MRFYSIKSPRFVGYSFENRIFYRFRNTRDSTFWQCSFILKIPIFLYVFSTISQKPFHKDFFIFSIFFRFSPFVRWHQNESFPKRLKIFPENRKKSMALFLIFWQKIQLKFKILWWFLRFLIFVGDTVSYSHQLKIFMRYDFCSFRRLLKKSSLKIRISCWDICRSNWPNFLLTPVQIWHLNLSFYANVYVIMFKTPGGIIICKLFISFKMSFNVLNLCSL